MLQKASWLSEGEHGHKFWSPNCGPLELGKSITASKASSQLLRGLRGRLEFSKQSIRNSKAGP